MLFSLLFASQFLLMSDRASFWDADKISHHTQIMEDSVIKDMDLSGKEFKGKNILLLVHGYNSEHKEALSNYHLINAHVSAFSDALHSQFYDLVIGYLWPGDAEPLDYYDAKHHVSKLAKKMRSHLEVLSSTAAKVDVVAHSMGNRLMLDALDHNFNRGKKVVQNYFALAPAVDDESIEKKEKYFHSTQNCEKFFVFYSKRDEVLQLCYSIAEWDKALGYAGAEDPDKLPQNVQLINCTNIIGHHSQYFTALPVYEFIKQQFLMQKVPPMQLKKTIHL